MPVSRRIVVLAALAVSVTQLAAQAPCACPPKPADPPKPPYTLSADFALAQASGNQDVLTTSLGEKFTYQWPKWRFTQTANLVYGRANGITNAQLFTGGVRADYTLRANLTAFARFDALRNVPAGLASVLNQAVGLSWTLVKDERDELRFDVGVGALQRRFVAVAGAVQPSESDFVGNVDGYYRHKFSDVAYFEQTVNVVPNFTTTSGWLATARSSLVAPLSQRIGIKLGYLATFNNAPGLLPATPPIRPLPVRAQKFDGLFTAGLQFTL